MCGICGVITTDQYSAGWAISKMTSSLTHRGPDDEGYLLGNTKDLSWVTATGSGTIAEIPKNPVENIAGGQFNLAFGMRRLAILDLSSSGHGPMSYYDGDYWITYNGEIYNYIELRKELSSIGYKFQTATDTEVILAAYAQWGSECLQRFNGMWAFAIWDVKNGKLFCARDRFGIKPFNYHWDGQLFAFASEAKALLQHPDIQAKPDDAMVFDYLVRGLSHHSESTFLEGIKSLLPAHWMELDFARKQMAIRKWWDIEANESLEGPTFNTEDEIIEEFMSLLTDSVRLRLRTDVPVGTCLSGGLDSSTLVSIANHLLLDEKVLPPELIGDHQKTFSACFDDPEIDERQYITEVIHKTKADANYVFPEGRNGLWKELGELHWHQEGPVGSTSIYSQWAVMRLAKENNVTVLLDGQGADELLAGYPYYYGSYFAQFMRRRKIFEGMREATKAAATSGTSLAIILGLMLYELLPRSIKDSSQNFVNTTFRTNKTVPKSFLNDQFTRTFEFNRVVYYKNRGYNSLAEHLYDSLFFSSLPALLHYEDRNSMAFSIEARVPYLDFRLVELLFSLAASYRIREGWTKWILRKGTVGLLPDNVRWRKGKLGFATPENAWLKSNVDIISHMFNNTDVYSSDYINPSTIQELRKSSEEEFRITSNIWRLVSLESWMRSFWGG